MKKTFIFMAIMMVLKTFSDDFQFYSPNNHGSIGLINTPSARFHSAPSGILSFYRGFPDRKATLTLYPYDWLEASVFYASFKDRPYGNSFSQDYKDKGFNFKVRIKDQKTWPAIALGANDIGGTGLYSSEYVVSSYQRDNYDLHIGIGWGRMNHHNHFENPFIIFGNNFRDRDNEIGAGGELNLNNFFSGDGVSLFAGANFKFLSKYEFKIEYDPTQTPGEIKFKERKSDFNFGLNYAFKNYIFGLNLERGSNISINFSYTDNFQKKENDYVKIRNFSNSKYKNLINSLESNNIGVSRLEKNQEELSLSISQYIHSLKNLNKIIEKSVEEAQITEEVLVSYKIAGLHISKNKEIENSTLLFKNRYRGLRQNFSLNLKPFIAAREDFIKAALLLEHDAEFIFSENLFLSTNIKLSVADNFDDLIYPPVNVYPAQVRSDIKKYLNNIGDKPSIGRMQLEYFKTLSENNHILFSGGIYEDMFSGYGFEYLNFDMNRNLNWGFEAHEVYKRDYDFGFGLLGYNNITYHFNLFFQNREFIPFDLKVSYGEYLAGDVGTTFEIKRSFAKGVEIGAFASFTNVSYEDFGEGSFDKGIFFKIPIGKNRRLSNFIWRPLTKDPASKLVKKNNIYDLVNKYSRFTP